MRVRAKSSGIVPEIRILVPKEREYRVMKGGVLDRLLERMSVVVTVEERTVREKGNV